MPAFHVFNRFEIKFLLHYEQADEVRRTIMPYVTPDPHNGARGFYPVFSVYYDSPEYACFWERMEGEKFRRKLRVRKYGDDSGDDSYLEIKQRIDQTLQKRRTRGTAKEIMRELSGEVTCGALEDDSVMQEATYLVTRHIMTPQVAVGYNREAYFGLCEPGLRITFDRHLQYGKYDDSMGFPVRLRHCFIPHYLQVLEIKFNDRVPTWICACLNSLNLQSRRVSKYCYAVNKAVYSGELI